MSYRFNGGAVAKERERRGWRQTRLAGAADVTSVTLWRIETDRVDPKAATVCAVADALGVDPGMFFLKVDE